VAVVAKQLGLPGAEGAAPADQLGVVGVLEEQQQAVQDGLGGGWAGGAVESPQLLFGPVELGQGGVLAVDGGQDLGLPGGQFLLVLEQGS
jgi:hypothetical protein